MIEMKTTDLIGPALDWAVAKADGQLDRFGVCAPAGFKPSTDWSQGGAIIDRLMQRRFGISSERHGQIVAQSPGFEGWGATALIAAMRCLVASKLGDTVHVPKELV